MHQLKCPVCKRVVRSDRQDVLDAHGFPTSQDVFLFAYHKDGDKWCEGSGKPVNPPRKGEKKPHNVFIKFRKP
jgi:hypothetical protein